MCISEFLVDHPPLLNYGVGSLYGVFHIRKEQTQFHVRDLLVNIWKKNVYFLFAKKHKFNALAVSPSAQHHGSCAQSYRTRHAQFHASHVHRAELRRISSAKRSSTKEEDLNSPIKYLGTRRRVDRFCKFFFRLKWYTCQMSHGHYVKIWWYLIMRNGGPWRNRGDLFKFYK